MTDKINPEERLQKAYDAAHTADYIAETVKYQYTLHDKDPSEEYIVECMEELEALTQLIWAQIKRADETALKDQYRRDRESWADRFPDLPGNHDREPVEKLQPPSEDPDSTLNRESSYDSPTDTDDGSPEGQTLLDVLGEEGSDSDSADGATDEERKTEFQTDWTLDGVDKPETDSEDDDELSFEEDDNEWEDTDPGPEPESDPEPTLDDLFDDLL